MKNKINDIPKDIVRIIILMGVVVGFLSLNTVAPTMDFGQCDQHEEADCPSSGEQEEIKAYDAVHSNAQISLEHEYFLLAELPEFSCEDEDSELSEQSISLSGSKVLKILFRRIISPNAP